MNSKFDPKLPLGELINQIRACDEQEYPANFMLHGEKLCVKLWRPDKGPSEDDLL